MRRLLPLLALTPALAFAAPADLASARTQMVEDLSALRFSKLGNPVTRWDHIPPVYSAEDAPHNLLVITVQFTDKTFERFAGDAKQGEKLAAWYQDKLFDPTYERPNTLSHYYKTQSLGTYHLQGHVLPPITLSKPLADYGRSHRPEGGDWRNDRDPEGLVEEALALTAKTHPDLNWADFDRWDPEDYDGDGLLNEPDGYLDHLVLVYAGGGQNACHGLFKLQRKLNPNVGMEVLETLSAKELACGDRLWPHRFMIQKRGGQGPSIEGWKHPRGGAQLRPNLWARDYNMQSEYTEPSTFIHEFGHSVGLPDVYARTSSNSSGGWEVMSSTSSPMPQNMSAWSRIQLGWLTPKVIRPTDFDGAKVQSLYLRRLDAPVETPKVATAQQAAGLYRAAMVLMPPKTRELKLATPPQGKFALYSGQGNQMNRTAVLKVDLKGAKEPTLSMKVWHQIEAGWDFAYLEASTDGGTTWTRLQPKNPKHFSAKHGHDGKQTLPGFTGVSGDLDGDGKNESNKDCNPKEKIASGEDKAGKKASACKVATWVKPSFDLSPYAGSQAQIRLQYFTDMAAVEPGMLIDDLKITGLAKDFADDFEAERRPRAWTLDGWTRSPGVHTLLVPHYYLLEYRDPYAKGSYDEGIAKAARPMFFYDLKQEKMRALRIRPRPGVVAWYYDGEYPWSENDPASNGPGHGYLLALDAWPNEVAIPGLEAGSRGQYKTFDTHYDLKALQTKVRDAYRHTMCFVRNADYRPVDLDAKALGGACATEQAGSSTLKIDGKQALFGYEKANILPGPERDKVAGITELFDYKTRGKKPTVWRLRDRSLRYLHTLDSPFSLTAFEGGYEVLDLEGDGLKVTYSAPHPAVPQFSDAMPKRWQNAKLPFGGVAVPDGGLNFKLVAPKPEAPAGSEVKVYFNWQ